MKLLHRECIIPAENEVNNFDLAEGVCTLLWPVPEYSLGSSKESMMDRFSQRGRRMTGSPKGRERHERQAQRVSARMSEELERTSYRLYYPLVSEWEHPDGVRFDLPRD